MASDIAELCQWDSGHDDAMMCGVLSCITCFDHVVLLLAGDGEEDSQWGGGEYDASL